MNVFLPDITVITILLLVVGFGLVLIEMHIPGFGAPGNHRCNMPYTRSYINSAELCASFSNVTRYTGCIRNYAWSGNDFFC